MKENVFQPTYLTPSLLCWNRHYSDNTNHQDFMNTLVEVQKMKEFDFRKDK